MANLLLLFVAVVFVFTTVSSRDTAVTSGRSKDRYMTCKLTFTSGIVQIINRSKQYPFFPLASYFSHCSSIPLPSFPLFTFPVSLLGTSMEVSCHTESNSHSEGSLRTQCLQSTLPWRCHVILNPTVTRKAHLEHNVYSLHFHGGVMSH